MVFPQLDFRLETDNSVPAISRSTRYTDFALIDSLPWRNRNNELISVKTQPLIALEIKPPESKIEVAMCAAIESVVNQIRHHFWAQEETSSMEMIAIAAVGKKWQWAIFKKMSGMTPGPESTEGSEAYMMNHARIAQPITLPGRRTPWSERVTVREQESKRELEEISRFIKSHQLVDD